MSEVKKKKKKLSASALVLIIACVIIAIPIIVFLVIIISASLKNGTPVLGNRFDNDLNPSISDANKSAIVRDVETISGVENCEIVMTSAQLRVNVDVKDNLTDKEIEEITLQAYDAVSNTLPINTYFKMSNDGERMYDLSINAYNYIPSSNEDTNWISYVLTKNSKMDTYEIQNVAAPVNPELASELRGETVGGEDEPEGENEGEQASE